MAADKKDATEILRKLKQRERRIFTERKTFTTAMKCFTKELFLGKMFQVY